MADLTNVDGAKIRATAQKLADIDLDILACVRKINDALAALDKGWQSEVKTGFMQNWQHDAEALCEMMEQYTEVQQLLSDAAAEFDRAEEEMRSQVSSLR